MIIINVRLNRRDNQEWTIQRNGKHWQKTQKDGEQQQQQKTTQSQKKQKKQTNKKHTHTKTKTKRQNNKDKLAGEQHITPQIHKVNPRARERYAALVSYKTTAVIPIVRQDLYICLKL